MFEKGWEKTLPKTSDEQVIGQLIKLEERFLLESNQKISFFKGKYERMEEKLKEEIINRFESYDFYEKICKAFSGYSHFHIINNEKSKNSTMWDITDITYISGWPSAKILFDKNLIDEKKYYNYMYNFFHETFLSNLEKEKELPYYESLLNNIVRSVERCIEHNFDKRLKKSYLEIREIAEDIDDCMREGWLEIVEQLLLPKGFQKPKFSVKDETKLSFIEFSLHVSILGAACLLDKDS